MPSWLDNLWALSPWAAEPERDAAQAPSLAPFLPPFEPLEARPAPPPPTGPRTSAELPDITYESDEWFVGLKKNWPTVEAVIPPELWVSQEMKYVEVKNWVNRHVTPGGTPREKIECFDVANYQLSRKGFKTGGRPSLDPGSWQILINYREDGALIEEVQVPETIEAVLYIREALQQNIPVLVGICLRNYENRDGSPARPNNVKSTWFIEPTNHYVVIVGADRDNYGHPYFQYYDYYFRPGTVDGDACKLFLNTTMKLERADGRVVMAEVRRTLKL